MLFATHSLSLKSTTCGYLAICFATGGGGGGGGVRVRVETGRGEHGEINREGDREEWKGGDARERNAFGGRNGMER